MNRSLFWLTRIGLAALPLAACAQSGPTALGDPRFAPASTEAACNTLAMASTGGPVAKDAKTLVVRWLGFSTFELIYGDKVILLDNYYDRGPRYRDLGFHAADVKRADLILVGHAHHAHMSDTGQVAKQTGAPVVAAPITIAKLRSQGVQDKQLVEVAGKSGDHLSYAGFEIEPVLGRHGEPPKVMAEFAKAYTDAIPKPTEAETKIEEAIRDKGSRDEHIIDQGEIAFVITFDTGFRLAWRDSGGEMTIYEKAAMQRYRRTDVLLGAIAASGPSEVQAQLYVPMLTTYRPDVVFPAHHEEEVGRNIDRATEPMFQYGKAALPNAIFISKLYREPTCFDTRRNVASNTR